MQKRATALDVARIAGVSRATVSRAFSAAAVVDRSTRARVLAAAEELNYQPHPIARSLNRSRSDLVAIIVNNLRNPFEAQVHDLLVSGLVDLKLQPLLVPIEEKHQTSQRLRAAAGYQVSAAMTWADGVTADDVRASFGSSTPCIMVNGQVGDNVDTARSDPCAGVEAFVERTCSTHRRYAYLAGRKGSSQSRERADCLQRSLQRHNRSIEAFGEGDFTYDAGYRAALTMLRGRSQIDCLIAANDAMAMGAMDGARHILGLRVPEDLSVVGFDGIDAGGWSSYDLTTITVTIPAFVESLLDLLTARFAEPDRPSEHRALPTRLLERSSCRLDPR